MKRLIMVLAGVALLFSGTVYAQDPGNTIVFQSRDQDLSIRAVINTEETGPIEAVWRPGDQAVTQRGDEVVWGLFYAGPDDVTWGSRDNPDLYVKIWFDVSGRLDVNFFHVSVPDIQVYSDFPADGSADQQGTTTMSRRYIRQFYENGQRNSEAHEEDGLPAPGYSENNTPMAYATINSLDIGSSIITEEKGPVDAVWHLGGTDTTEAGDQVVWGHFYASPSDVSWGSGANPDLFVKIWFDHSGRIDVNFFHVSVPDIEVYSDYPDDQSYDQAGTTIMADRYIRQEYTRQAEPNDVDGDGYTESQGDCNDADAAVNPGATEICDDSIDNNCNGLTDEGCTPPATGNLYYVAADGDDGNPGSLTQPWQTIQKAADTVAPGSIVYVRGGVYREQVTIQVSGSAAAGYVTFRNYEGEVPIVDGTGFSVPPADNGLFLIKDRNYIIIQGFELRNYRTSTPDILPVAISIRGAGTNIQILDNRIHTIETNAEVDDELAGADAHGIAVYGTSGSGSLNNIIINGNELYDLKLGSSEALVLNGNVENFTVSNNTIHDVDNIGIDMIGFEGTSPDTASDQARNGVVRNNTVYNVSSYGNPAYGNEYSAAGIYVDGGTKIVIERNTVYSCDFGVEIASEHQNRSTSNITVRNNFIFRNRVAGIAMGGYDELRGSTIDCSIVNNTLYHNDTLMDGSGELYMAFDNRNNTIKNNICFANDQSLFIGNSFTQNTGNSVDYNLYFASAGAEFSEWQWKDETYQGFSAYQSATGNDQNSLFVNPDLVDPDGSDLHLRPTSPAVDAGTEIPETGSHDVDGQDRIQGSTIDLGADELPRTTLR